MKNILLKVLLTFAIFAGANSAIAQTALINVDPAPSDQPYQYNTYYDVQLFFSDKITFESAVFSYGETEIPLTGFKAEVIRDEQNCIIMIISPPTEDNYVRQALEAGFENFTLTVSGVESNGVPVSIDEFDNEYVKVDNGTVTLTYSLETAPVYLPEESTWPKVFYEYWAPGDPDALATLVFDKPIASVYEASVIMAEVYQGSTNGGDNLNSYDLNPIIDGNKIILDFAGVHREGSSKIVTVLVNGITGVNGIPVDFGASVSLYQYINYSATEAGIEGLYNDKSEVVKAFNLKGVKENPSSLSPGIHVINGQKVLIK